MLFYGPPGTGKTSTVLALAKELYGPQLWRSRVLELNASDERGISIVREKVKDFARLAISTPSAEYKKSYPCPPFKIIILDEADSMTQDAQSALRRTMETYSRITRFCLVCNYVTRIIDPLASRCSKFRFKSLNGQDARQRLEDIATAEKVKLAPGAIDTLIETSEGDLRRAITSLQSAARLIAATAKTKQDDDDDDVMDLDSGDAVTSDLVGEIAGVVPPELIETIVKALQPNQRGSAYNRLAPIIEGVVADGWSAAQILAQLFQAVVFDDSFKDKAKYSILGVFSEADKRLIDGTDEHLVLLDVTLQIAGHLQKGK
jgi:replication factor C subunit 2/4